VNDKVTTICAYSMRTIRFTVFITPHSHKIREK